MARTALAGKSNRKSKGKQGSSDGEGLEVVMNEIDVSSSDDLQVEQLKLPHKVRSTKPGKTNGKGKSKAESTRAETDSVSDTELPEIRTLIAEAKATASANLKKASTPAEARLRSQLERSEKARKEAETSSEKYRKVAEEAFRIRVTEGEQNFADQEAQLEARIAQQANHIQELQNRLFKVEPLQRSAANTYVLELLTRETAEEEKKEFEREIVKWKNVSKEKDKIIAEKEAQIANLMQQEAQLQKELKAEIEHSKTLGSKNARAVPPSSTRGQVVVADNPKNGEVVKFYEDVTNIIIPNVKFSTSQYFKIDEPTLSCVFTYSKSENGNTSNEHIKSLSFSLYLYNEPDQEVEVVTSPDQLVPRVTFIPHELDKETPEFVNALNFLGSNFTFGRYQLPLFLEQLQQLMAAASSTGEEEDDDDEVELLPEDPS